MELGQATVQIKADLSPLESSLAQGRQKVADFDRQAGAGFNKAKQGAKEFGDTTVDAAKKAVSEINALTVALGKAGSQGQAMSAAMRRTGDAALAAAYRQQKQAIVEIEHAWDGVKSSLDPVYAAQLKVANSMKQLRDLSRDAVKAGVVTAQEAKALVDQISQTQMASLRAIEHAARDAPLLNAFKGVSEAARMQKAATDAATASAAAGWDRVKASMDPVFAATIRISEGLQQVRAAAKAAVDAGVASSHEAQAMVNKIYTQKVQELRAIKDAIAEVPLKNAFAGVGQAAQGQVAAIAGVEALLRALVPTTAKVSDEFKKLKPYAANIGAQFSDIGVSLAAGQKPWLVMIQQGSQLQYIMQIAGVSLRSFLTPLNLAIAGLTVLAGVMLLAVARAISMENQLRTIQLTLAATGNSAQLAATDIQQMIETVAQLPRFTRESANEASAALLRNPLISGEVFKKALPLVADFAAAIGKTIPEAAQEMASALTSGEQGANKLLTSYNSLTAAEVQQVKELMEMGRTADSVNIILGGFTRTAAQANAIGISPLSATMKALTNAWDDFVKSMARSGVIKDVVGTLTEMLRILKAILELDLKAIAATLFVAQPGSVAAKMGVPVAIPNAAEQASQIKVLKDELTELNRVIAETQAKGPVSQRDQKVLEGLTKRAQDITLALRDLEVQAVKTAPAVEKALAPPGPDNQQQAKVLEWLDNLNDVVKRRRELEGQISQIEKAVLLDPTLTEKSAEALKKLRGELFATQTEEQKWAKQMKDERELLNEAIPLRGALAEKQRVYQEWMTKTGDATTATKKAAEAYDIALRKATEASALAFQALTSEAQAALVVAETYLRAGEAAGAYAKQLAAAQIAAARGELLGASPEEFARTQIQLQAASGIENTALRIAQLEKQAIMLNKVADAERQSAMAGQEARVKEQALLELDQLRTLALQSKNAALVTAVDKLLPEYMKVLNAQIAAETKLQAIQASRQYDPIKAYQDELDRIERLQKSGELTVRAEVEMRQEAYVKMAKSGDDWLAGSQAGLMEYAKSARSSAATIANAFTEAFTAIEDNLARMMVGMETSWKQMFQSFRYQLAKAQIQSIVNMGGSALGLNGGSSGGVGGGFDINSILNLFGGGSSSATTGSGEVTSSGNWRDITINPDGTAGRPGLGGGGLPSFGGAGFMGSVFSGAESGWQLGGMGGAGLAGAAPGMLGGAMNIASGLMGWMNARGTGDKIAAGGSMVGGALMMIPTPWTQIAGMVISIGSQIAGALIGNKTPKPQAEMNILFGPNANPWDYARIGPGNESDNGNIQGVTEGAEAIANSVGRILYGIGAKPTAGVLGGWLLNSQGDTTGDQWIAGLGDYFSGGAGVGNKNTGGTAEELANALGADEAVGQVITGMIRRAADDNKLIDDGSGLFSDIMKKVLQNTTAESVEELETDIGIGKAYENLLNLGRPADQLLSAIEGLHESFRATAFEAGRLGLNVDLLKQQEQTQLLKIGSDWAENLANGVLQQTNPFAFAKQQNQKTWQLGMDEREALFQEGAISAQQYADSLANLNKLLGLANENAFTSTAGNGISQLMQNLVYGPLSLASPTQTYSGLQASFAATTTAALAGDPAALGRYANEAATYTDFINRYFGGDARAAAERSQILSTSATLLATHGDPMAEMSTNIQSLVHLFVEAVELLRTGNMTAGEVVNRLDDLTDGIKTESLAPSNSTVIAP